MDVDSDNEQRHAGKGMQGKGFGLALLTGFTAMYFYLESLPPGRGVGFWTS